MSLGGKWHRVGDIEIIPVFAPTLIVSELGPEYNDFGMPGEFLVIEGMHVWSASYEQVQTHFVCDELPELAVVVIGQRDFE